jgi:hypothetical protein
MTQEYESDNHKTALVAAANPLDAIIGADQSIGLSDTKGRFKFTRLEDRKPGTAWNLLLYGSSKTGKTYFAGTAGPRTLFLNLGEGLETLKSPAFTSKYPDSQKMIVIDVREHGVKGVSEAYEYINDALDYALKTFPDQFDTVVLDEATAYRKFAMNRAMDLNTGTRTTVRVSRSESFVKPDVGDYGLEMQMVEWFLGTYIPIFKEANKNFLMLAHERQVFAKPPKIGDEPVLKRILPGFTGKTFPDAVPQFFDDVWRSEVINSRIYRVRTAGTEMEIGGTRHGGIFAPVEIDPNYIKMLDRIRAGKLYTGK